MFLLLDKPQWRSSFDCIRKLQRLYGKKIYDQKIKIWHAGTLDPMATGLMIIAIGKSTKQLGTLTGLDKTYVATIDLSQMTDTWDDEAWGWRARCEQGVWKSEISPAADDGVKDQKPSKRIQYKKIPFILANESWQEIESSAAKRWYTVSSWQQIPTEAEIKTVLKWFMSREDFLLTPFSAKKIEGKKLYEYAREGNPILKQSSMSLISCELVEYNFPHVQVKFYVWSGTYIRSLGFELGRALGWGGILVALRRESIGGFSL